MQTGIETMAELNRTTHGSCLCTLIVNSHKNDKYPKHNCKHIEYSRREIALSTTKWNAIYVPSQLFNSHFYKTTLITNAIDKSVRFLSRQA